MTTTLTVDVAFADAFDPSAEIARNRDRDQALQYCVLARALFGPAANESTPLRIGPFLSYAVVPGARHTYAAGASYVLTGRPHGSNLGELLVTTLSVGPAALVVDGGSGRAAFGPSMRVDLGVPLGATGLFSGPVLGLFADAGWFPSGPRAEIAVGFAFDPIAFAATIMTAAGKGSQGPALYY